MSCHTKMLISATIGFVAGMIYITIIYPFLYHLI